MNFKHKSRVSGLCFFMYESGLLERGRIAVVVWDTDGNEARIAGAPPDSKSFDVHPDQRVVMIKP